MSSPLFVTLHQDKASLNKQISSPYLTVSVPLWKISLWLNTSNIAWYFIINFVNFSVLKYIRRSYLPILEKERFIFNLATSIQGWWWLMGEQVLNSFSVYSYILKSKIANIKIEQFMIFSFFLPKILFSRFEKAAGWGRHKIKKTSVSISIDVDQVQ